MPNWANWRSHLASFRDWWSPYRIAVGAVFVAFALGCFREIGNYWQFGHNGYNGSTYLQAAVNSVRFGLWGQVKYYYGFDPPPLHEYFVHHPLLLHVHLVPLVAALGRDPWVGRLVPATYSVLNMGVLFLIVRRYWGKREALISVVLFLLLPINLVYANMIDHEQGAIFSCLLTLLFYFRWRETLSTKYFWLVMLGITLATQWEWVGYYLALFLVLHAFACGLRRDNPFRWHPEYTFCFLFSIVVLGNAAAFFGYAFAVKGSLQDLFQAFNQRSSAPNNYWPAIWNYTKTHYGLLPVGLFALWTVYFMFRWIRGELHRRDLVPLCFFLIQVVHSTLFKQAGKIHSYWIYYFGVAVAAGGAEVLGKIFGKLRGLSTWIVDLWQSFFGDDPAESSGRAVFGVQLALFLIVASIPFTAQARFTWKRMNVGYRKGGIPNFDNYDSQLDQIVFAKAVGERFPRKTTYHIHQGFNFTRTEWKYYLDGPTRRRRNVVPPQNPIESDHPHVFLVDIVKVGNRRALTRLVRAYRTYLFNRRYLAVELTEPDGPFQPLVRTTEEPSVFWSWFVNGRFPPGDWVEDPDVSELDRLFPKDFELADTFETGGQGGIQFRWTCPVDMYLKGFDFDVENGLISAARPICSPRGEASNDSDGLYLGPAWSNPTDSWVRRLKCPGERIVTGVQGRSGGMVDAFGIICGIPDPDASPPKSKESPSSGGDEKSDSNSSEGDAADSKDTSESETGTNQESDEKSGASGNGADESPTTNGTGDKPAETHPRADQFNRHGPVGGSGGNSFEFLCPPGTAAWMFRGRFGRNMDRGGIGCRDVEQLGPTSSD